MIDPYLSEMNQDFRYLASRSTFFRP